MSSPSQFNARHYGLRSATYHWRVNLAVALGVVVGTAVLTGALIVGDSVRASLKRLTVERLGRVDEIVLSSHFFSADHVTRLRAAMSDIPAFDAAEGVILMGQATAEHPSGTSQRRTGQVTVLGCSPGFWELDTGVLPQVQHPQNREVVLNQPLADDLDAEVGDRIILRLPKATRVAGDSPLGEKTDRVESLAELKVIQILPAEGLGRFSLQTSQAMPRTAFVNLGTVQVALDQSDRLNAILVAGPVPDQAPSDAATTEIQDQFQPSLEDAGLQLKTVELNYLDDQADETRTSFRYLGLSTDTMMFSENAEQIIEETLGEIRYEKVLTYLANSIALTTPANKTSIPYSTVSAVAASSNLSPLVANDGTEPAPLGANEIILNSWAANDLNAQVGDTVRLTYFAPETTHGEPEERTADFRLAGIVPIVQPLLPYENGKPARYVTAPTRANDPDLTPTVPGVTDQESIDAWDPPFPFYYDRIRVPKDEDYWDAYRTTPKAFVNKQAGNRLWGSRFGKTTSFRIAFSDIATESTVRERLLGAVQNHLSDFGFQWLHVKRDGLQAASGTTPFNLLFLGFSFFIIASALMLVSLLFRLNLEQRAREAGLLLAVGLEPQEMRRLFSYEGRVIAGVAGLLGVLVGIGYAALMLLGLRTWWLDAVVTPFLRLSVHWPTLIIGAGTGIITALVTMRWTLRGLSRQPAQRLLAGKPTSEASLPSGRRKAWSYAAWGLAGLAVVSGVIAVFLNGEAQAGAFFTSGGSVLVSLLIWTDLALRTFPRTKQTRGLTLTALALRNLSRNATRSILTIALMATACFLIVAISAFRLRPTEAGTGGMRMLAQSDTPIFDDLNDAEVRLDLLGSMADSLRDTTILSLRMQDGDDASCRNLYQVQRPRVLGLTDAWMNYYDNPAIEGFGWAGHAATTEAERANPWHCLQVSMDDAIPVIIDKNTAMYSLHLYGGVGEVFEVDYGSGNPLTFRVVGLLANSVLQGSLLVAEDQLLSHFPNVSGYRYFAIDCPAEKQQDVRATLEDLYQDQGFETVDTRRILADLLAVQNTYLSTFQSLGGLGLLLGSFGLVAVQLRSVLERKGELALLRASGFATPRISRLVLSEHLLLLVSGLGIGVIAALVAVLPHAWTTQISPPWDVLFVLLTLIMTSGLATGYLALRPIVKSPLVQALRTK